MHFEKKINFVIHWGLGSVINLSWNIGKVSFTYVGKRIVAIAQTPVLNPPISKLKGMQQDANSNSTPVTLIGKNSLKSIYILWSFFLKL